ncbi:MAG: outer membrane channel protein TolC [Gammaproteobacteria bacterium]|nr:MAG: outer membrane channel protein TolC [Gammaproteobacteria bacterium]
MKIINLTAIFFLFSISASSFADDLISVYQAAIQNDPQFRGAQAEYRAQLESKTQSIAAFLPTISLSANYTENKEELTGGAFLIPGTYNSTDKGYNLNLTQPLYRHENYIGLHQADAQVAQAKAIFKDASQNLILRIATQYFAILAAEDDLVFAIAERKAIKQQLVQTQQRFNVGLIAITDVHEAQARYDQSVARAIVAENTLLISRENLREITAKEHSELASLTTIHPLVKPVPADIKQWLKTAATENALLIASQKAMDIAREEVSRQRAGHYPTLDLIANRSYNDFSGGSFGQRQRDNTSVSLQLTIPFYQGGLINSRTRAAAFRLEQAREKLEQQRRATERQTRSAYLNVIANISQVKALKQALASSSIALEATQAGFEVGTRTAVDVLNSQRELYRARRDYAQARYNYVLETLSLKLAAGTLSVVDLEKLNPWLK